MNKFQFQAECIDHFLDSNIIQIANIQHREGPYFFPKHLHNNLEIYRILEGSCQMEIGNMCISCLKDDFIMILPNIAHSLSLLPDFSCTFEHIHFSSMELTQISLEKYIGSPVTLLDTLVHFFTSYHQIPTDTFLSSRISSIISEMEKPALFSQIQMNLQILELLIHLLQSSNRDFSNLSSKNSTQNLYVLTALQYIEKNYASKIQITNIADEIHISPRYLNKLFSKYTHMSLLSYINVFRMNEAVKLMSNPRLTLAEIASMVGMNDSQHFSRLFKDIMGSSPGQYRKTLINEDLKDAKKV